MFWMDENSNFSTYGEITWAPQKLHLAAALDQKSYISPSSTEKTTFHCHTQPEKLHLALPDRKSYISSPQLTRKATSSRHT
jgi:hypothetical protein